MKEKAPSIDNPKRSGNRRVLPVVATALAVAMGASACSGSSHKSTENKTYECIGPLENKGNITLPKNIEDAKLVKTSLFSRIHWYRYNGENMAVKGTCLSPAFENGAEKSIVDATKALNAEITLQVQEIANSGNRKFTVTDDTGIETQYSIESDKTTGDSTLQIKSLGSFEVLKVNKTANKQSEIGFYSHKVDPFKNTMTLVRSGSNAISGVVNGTNIHYPEQRNYQGSSPSINWFMRFNDDYLALQSANDVLESFMDKATQSFNTDNS